MLHDVLGFESGVDARAVTTAAHVAARSLGAVGWSVAAFADRVEFRVRPAVRDHGSPAARVPRLACGAALCNARLTVLAHGRTPLLRHPPDGDVVATLRVGPRLQPEPDVLGLYGRIADGAAPGPPAPAGRVRSLLRRTADVSGVWWRYLPDAPVPPPGTGPSSVTALLGRPRADPVADLRLGQAVQLMRLVVRGGPGWDLDAVAPLSVGHSVAVRTAQRLVRVRFRPSV